jgi:hypothetical protein
VYTVAGSSGLFTSGIVYTIVALAAGASRVIAPPPAGVKLTTGTVPGAVAPPLLVKLIVIVVVVTATFVVPGALIVAPASALTGIASIGSIVMTIAIVSKNAKIFLFVFICKILPEN